MDQFDKRLKEILKQNLEFVDSETDDLSRNEIVNHALKADKDLIELLIKNKEIRETFFDKIKDYWVFNINKFVDYIENIKILSNSYTRFKNQVGLNINNKFLRERGEVSLVWPFKDCVLEGGMTKEDQERNEIFFNEILAKDEIDRLFDPKVLTNFKKYTAKGEEKVKDFNRNKDGTIKDNLIIKGNNLLSLHSLKKEFAGKVKLIYIDPPYNTAGEANTFKYNNAFNHSTWMTFIRNRIEATKELLTDNGVMAIAIDDEEQAYLTVLCDEIFGKENHMGTLIIQNKPSGRTTDAYFATCHEYVLFYSKIFDHPSINFFELTEEQKNQYKEGQGEDLYKWRDFLRTGGFSTPEERPNSYYPIYYNSQTGDISLESKGNNYIKILPLDSNGTKRVWRKTPASFLDHLKKEEIQISMNSSKQWKVKIIDRIKVGIRPKSIWIDSKYDASSYGTKLLKNLFGGDKIFSYPKSINAVKDIIKIFTDIGGDDIVLDFFAGSGTTGHAVLELNAEDHGRRQFILCEQMDYIESVTSKRIKKVLENQSLDDSFIYFELMKYNQEAIEKIRDAKDTKQLLKIWDEMCEKYFLNYDVEIKKFNDNKKLFEEMTLKQQKEELTKMLNKNQLYVNLSEIEDSQFKVSKEDKELNKRFYGDY